MIVMESPEIGEWWMCESESGRTCPMLKVKKGWGCIRGKDGLVESAYINKGKTLTPLHKMVKA